MRSPTIAWWRGGAGAGRVARQAASHMDLLPSLAELAGAKLPPGLALDGASIAALLRGGGSGPDRPVFLYRGNMLYAVRLGEHKAHYYTWTTGQEELQKGIDLCPRVSVPNVTTTDIRCRGGRGPAAQGPPGPASDLPPGSGPRGALAAAPQLPGVPAGARPH
jgi:N-acetylgalactosamine-6-sulfatase